MSKKSSVPGDHNPDQDKKGDDSTSGIPKTKKTQKKKDLNIVKTTSTNLPNIPPPPTNPSSRNPTFQSQNSMTPVSRVKKVSPSTPKKKSHSRKDENEENEKKVNEPTSKTPLLPPRSKQSGKNKKSKNSPTPSEEDQEPEDEEIKETDGREVTINVGEESIIADAKEEKDRINLHHPFQIHPVDDAELHDSCQELHKALTEDLVQMFAKYETSIATILKLNGTPDGIQVVDDLSRKIANTVAHFMIKMLTSVDTLKALSDPALYLSPFVYVFDLLKSSVKIVQHDGYDAFVKAFESMDELGIGWLLLFSIGSALVNAANPPFKTDSGALNFFQISWLLISSLVINVFVNSLYNPKTIYENFKLFKKLYYELKGTPLEIWAIRVLNTILVGVCLWVAVDNGAATAAGGVNKNAHSGGAAVVLFFLLMLPAAFQRFGNLFGRLTKTWESIKKHEKKHDVELNCLETIAFLFKDYFDFYNTHRSQCNQLTYTALMVMYIAVLSPASITYISSTTVGWTMLVNMTHNMTSILDQDITHPVDPGKWSVGEFFNSAVSGVGSFVYLVSLSYLMISRGIQAKKKVDELATLWCEIDELRQLYKSVPDGFQLQQRQSNSRELDIQDMRQFVEEKPRCYIPGNVIRQIKKFYFKIVLFYGPFLLGTGTGVGLGLAGEGTGKSWVDWWFPGSQSKAFPAYTGAVTGWLVSTFNMACAFTGIGVIADKKIPTAKAMQAFEFKQLRLRIFAESNQDLQQQLEHSKIDSAIYTLNETDEDGQRKSDTLYRN